MFLVTNRNMTRSDEELKKLGPKLNVRGPNELRLVEVTKSGTGWKVDILPDRIDSKMKRQAGISQPGTVYASEYVAKKTIKNLQKKKRNLLFFVHGFNNDIEAVLERAEKLEKNYDLEVIPFSWPANGGGVKGVASYKSDKRDAKASVGALDRCFAKLYQLLQRFNEQRIAAVNRAAEELYPENLELRERYITEEAEKGWSICWRTAWGIISSSRCSIHRSTAGVDCCLTMWCWRRRTPTTGTISTGSTKFRPAGGSMSLLTKMTLR